jgi:1-acyl-sn-glycerol-3-phosphate acyltransferase
MRFARAGVCLFLVLLQGIVFEVWIRLALLRRRRAKEEQRVAALNRLIRLWGASNLRIVEATLGARLRLLGRPPAGGRYILVSNHQSSLDCPLLIAVFRAQNLKFVAKEELRHGKLAVSAALRHGGSAFVGKESVGEDLAALARFGRDMARFDGSPVLFPEGWRATDGSLLPFHSAGVEAVRRASRLPLLPVVVDGLHSTPTIFGIHRLVGATVTLSILDPLPGEEVERDPRGAYREIEARMWRSLEETRSGGGRTG